MVTKAKTKTLGKCATSAGPCACAKKTVGGNASDAEYDRFVADVNARFRQAQATSILFTTDLDVFPIYLREFPAAIRQFHTCHSCRTFMENYGNLVTIDESGLLTPAMWDDIDATEEYLQPVQGMIRRLQKANVTGVFASSEKILGKPVTGIWHHFAVSQNPGKVYARKDLTASQWQAEKVQDFKTVHSALNEYSARVLETAVDLLQAESLYRSEKVLGPAVWLADLARACSGLSPKRKLNVIWWAVGSAPAGFCHPKSSMIGTLLADLCSVTLTLDDVKRRFAAKMNVTQYQRPQAAPSVGTVIAAEKLVEKLGIQSALYRRMALVDEIDAIWRPAPIAPQQRATGIFADLATKQPKPVVSEVVNRIEQRMTWAKFARTLLPTATRIEISPNLQEHVGAFTTAVYPDSEPIFQWDSKEAPNKIGLYCWVYTRSPERISVPANTWVDLVAIAHSPWVADGGLSKYPHLNQSLWLFPKGARETDTPSMGLFPKFLRSELHPVRAVIEQFNRQNTLPLVDHEHAAGILRSATGSSCNPLVLKVHTGTTVTQVVVDRWD